MGDKDNGNVRTNAIDGGRISRERVLWRYAPAINDAREKGLIRLIDYAFLSKDADGTLSGQEGTDLGPVEVEEMGAVVGGLIGLGAGGREGAKKGAKAGAERAKEKEMTNERTYGLSQDDIDDIVDAFPKNSSAAFAIIEHLWAKDIKQAVMDSNGTVLVHGMLTPELLVMLEKHYRLRPASDDTKAYQVRMPGEGSRTVVDHPRRTKTLFIIFYNADCRE